MTHSARSTLLRYGGAFLAVLLATVIRLALHPVLGDRHPFVSVVLALILTAWYGGLGPSLLALGLGAFAGAYIRLGAPGRLNALGVGDALSVGLFLAVGMAIVVFGEAGRTALRHLEAEVAERRRAEERLRESEGRFRQLAEVMPQIVWTAGPDGQVDYFNSRWYEYTEMTPEASLGEGWRTAIHPDDLARFSSSRDRGLGSGQVFEDEVRILQNGGTYRWHLVRSAPVKDETGRVVRRSGTATDFHDRRRAEIALREADRRKDEFLATLAHELRNPLAPIRAALHLMARPDPSGRAHEEERAMAERQVVHLARLIDDLMDVARISKGRMELHKEVVDLRAVVKQAAQTVQPLIDGRRHGLSISLPDETVPMEADPTRLEQVFWNLLTNAAKYTDPGGRINLTVERNGFEVIARVRDSGIGIEREMLPQLFQMFVQAGGHRTHAQGGLGIGLGLVKCLVEMHGGSISAASDGPGRGSEFVVRLPVLPADPARDEPKRPQVNAETATLPRRRILVVDDNADAARSLGRLLERLHGQDVRIAHDGPSALEIADSFRPEIALLDIGMPGMDGHELARLLRGRPEFENTVLVALSGWGQESDRRKSAEVGFDRHLVKPVDPEALRGLLSLQPRGRE